MDAATRRNIGIVVALVGLVLLVAVLGLVAVDTFLWAEPGAERDWAVLGGGCCCASLSGLLVVYGVLQAAMAARAA